MEKIEFDVTKLNKTERAGYLAMTRQQQGSFEKKWIAIEMAKAEMNEKIIKANRRAKAKEAREKELKRKADTHRKIENGALLEAVLRVHGAESLIEKEQGKKENERLREFLIFCMGLPEVYEAIQKI